MPVITEGRAAVVRQRCPRATVPTLAPLLCLVVLAGAIIGTVLFPTLFLRPVRAAVVPDGSDIEWRALWKRQWVASALPSTLDEVASFDWAERLTGTWTERGARRGAASVLYITRSATPVGKRSDDAPAWRVLAVQGGRRRVANLHAARNAVGAPLELSGADATVLCGGDLDACAVRQRAIPDARVGELEIGARRWCLASVVNDCADPFEQVHESVNSRFLGSIVPPAQRCASAWRLPESPSVDSLPALPYIWSKGWYNALGHVPSVPYEYYTQATGSTRPVEELKRMVEGVGPHGVFWLRLSSFPEDNDVKRFVTSVLPYVTMPFALVTTDGDISVNAPGYVRARNHQIHRAMDSTVIEALLASPHLTRWFTQNLAGTHAKLRGVPIGLDLHSSAHGPLGRFLDLDAARRRAPVFEERPCCAIYVDGGATTQWGGVERTDRHAVKEDLHQCSLARFHEGRLSQQAVWEEYGHQRFVVSADGNGLDCHRTWELILLGTIPIVRSGPLDALYDGLPVAIVRHWRDACNATLLREWSERLGPLTASAYRKITYERFLSTLPAAENVTRRMRLAPVPSLPSTPPRGSRRSLRDNGAREAGELSSAMTAGGAPENLLFGDVTLMSRSGKWLSASASGVVSLAPSRGVASTRWRIVDVGSPHGVLLRSTYGLHLEDRDGVAGLHFGEGAYQLWRLEPDDECGTHVLRSHRGAHLGEHDVGSLSLHATVQRFERWHIALASLPAAKDGSANDGGESAVERRGTRELVRLGGARDVQGNLVRDCELQNLAMLLNTKVPWSALDLVSTDGYAAFLSSLKPWLLGTPQWAWRGESGAGGAATQRHGERDAPPLECGASRYRRAFSTAGARNTERKPRAIVDFVPFGYDVDLLEVRFLELYADVDLFVVSECSSTQSGVKKPLFFNELRKSARFRQFLPKVMHIIYPAPAGGVTSAEETKELARMVADARNGGWELEKFFRKLPVVKLAEALARPGGVAQLHGISATDLGDAIVAIQSDADEIPTRRTMHHLKHCELVAGMQWPLYLPVLSGKKTVQWLQTTQSDAKRGDAILIDHDEDGGRELLAHIWRPGPYVWPLAAMIAAKDTLRYVKQFDGDGKVGSSAHTGMGSAFHMSSPLEPGLFWLKRGGVIEQSFVGAVSDAIASAAAERAAVTPRVILDGTASPWCSKQYTAKFVGGESAFSDAARALALESVPYALRAYRKRFCFHFPYPAGLYGKTARKEWGDVCDGSSPPPAY